MKIMKDRLKEYIQLHKTELDQRTPPAELIDKILDKSFPLNKKESGKTYKLFFSSPFKYYYAAASLILGIGLFYYYQNNTSGSTYFTNNPMQEISPLLSNQGSVIEQINDSETDLNADTNLISQQEIISHQNNIGTKILNNKIKLPNEKPNKLSSLSTVEKDHQNIEFNSQVASTIDTTENFISKDVVVNDSEIKNNETDNFNDNVLETRNAPVESNINKDLALEGDQAQSLGKTIRKGIFNMLSKKTSEWTDNTLTIKESESQHKTTIAVDFKSEAFEMSKSLSFTTK